MIVNKALIAAAVLLFTAPVVPALAHDDYGDRGYVRCLGIGVCPGSWHDHDGWRDHYWWPHHYGWRGLAIRWLALRRVALRRVAARRVAARRVGILTRVC